MHAADMTRYVAFLRGINSGRNPALGMDRLRRIFEDLGFQDVRTVIASGNVLFETGAADQRALEERVETAVLEKPGSTRSRSSGRGKRSRT